MQDALDEFLAESYENLDRLDRDLVAIEAHPGDRAALDAIFRVVHNLKGTCGFFPLPKLGAIAHAGENLLVRLRDGSIAWRAEVTNTLLAFVDAVRRDLAQIEATGFEVDEDHSALIDRLGRLQNETGPADLSCLPLPPGEGRGEGRGITGGSQTRLDRTSPGVPRPSPPAPLPGGEGRKTGPLASEIARGRIRVDVDLLDRLMDLVGELVLTRNQLHRHSSDRDDVELNRTSQRLNLVTSSLQEGVLKARMRPIGTIWDQLPRVVRDLAIDCGKLVEIVSEGGGTELDRTVIEAIKDPLAHLVRNAVDHGIEPPEVRRALGKPEAGRLDLRASHEGGLVLVEVRDDGAGIDPKRVAVEALGRGIIDADQADRLGVDDAIRLLFRPGFSTAEAITRISGRGVGLDVVRANIEAIGGTIEVRSALGQGTTVAIQVPLTLAIIPTLIVADGRGDRHAIPQPSLVELIHLEGPRWLEIIDGSPFVPVRGELLPLVELDEIFGGPGFDRNEATSLEVVVLQADGRRFGLVVAAILDTEEIVVKPLGRPIRSIPLFSGATVLGDGRVALIIDVHGLARAAKLVEIPALAGGLRP